MTLHRWRIALWLTAGGLVAYLLVAAGSAIMPIAVGGVIAYTLVPLVDRVAGWLPIRAPERETLRRGLAVAIVYLVFGAGLVLVLISLVPVLADQVVHFIETLPAYFDAAQQEAERLFREYRARVPAEAQTRIDGYGSEVLAAISGALSAAAKQSLGIVTGTLSVLFGYAVVPFLMFYAMRDRYELSRAIMRVVPPSLRDDASYAFTMADSVLGRYIRGQLFLGLIVGVAVGVTLTLLDVPLSLALGVWAGVTELIPIIGPWLGAIPALLLVFSAAPDKLLPVALTYLVVQQLENNLLVPRVQGEATDLHPGLVVVLLVLVGAAFGFVGLIVALPATAILRELFWYTDRRLRGIAPPAAFEASRAGRRLVARNSGGASAQPVPETGEAGTRETGE